MHKVTIIKKDRCTNETLESREEKFYSIYNAKARIFAINDDPLNTNLQNITYAEKEIKQ